DLAPIFAQFRRHPGKPERAVNLLFGPSRNHRAVALQTVLVEQEATPLGNPPQMHIVRLRAGKIGQRRAETLWGHDAQIDLQTVFQHDGRFRPARPGYLGDTWKGDEMLRDRGGIRGRGNDIEVADRLAPAPKAARDLQFLDRRAFAQIRAQLCGDPRGFDVEDSLSFRRLVMGQGFQDAFLDLRPKTANLADTLGFNRARQVIAVANMEMVDQQFEALRTEAWKIAQLEESGRKFRGQVVMQD